MRTRRGLRLLVLVVLVAGLPRAAPAATATVCGVLADRLRARLDTDTFTISVAAGERLRLETCAIERFASGGGDDTWQRQTTAALCALAARVKPAGRVLLVLPPHLTLTKHIRTPRVSSLISTSPSPSQSPTHATTPARTAVGGVSAIPIAAASIRAQ